MIQSTFIYYAWVANYFFNTKLSQRSFTLLITRLELLLEKVDLLLFSILQSEVLEAGHHGLPRKLGRITQRILLLWLRVLLIHHVWYLWWCLLMSLLLNFAQLVLAVSEPAAHAVLALSSGCHVPANFGLVVVLFILDAHHHLGLRLLRLESLDFYFDVFRHSYQFLVNWNQHVGV